MNITEIKAKLDELVGQQVNVENDASHQMDEHLVQLDLNGKLEGRDEDEGGNYYVRVKDCVMGSSGVSFQPEHVRDIWKQTYDHKILLK